MPLSSLITHIRPFALSLFAVCLIAQPAVAEDALTSAQKEAVKEVVRQFILDNPSVLIEAVNNFKVEEEQKAADEAKKALVEQKAFFESNALPFAGNPKGKTLIVEFFDYVCGYCKKAFPEVTQVINEDKDVKVVFVEMPILSEESHAASVWALAAHKQGKYFDLHKKLMEFKGPKTKDNLTKLAKEAGLDVAKLEKDAASPEIADAIKKNHEIAGKLGIQGTPGFIIGDEIIRGYVPYDGMKAIIAQQRGSKKE